MTKEELLRENAVVKENNKQLGEQNEKLRLDFARAFGWFKKQGPYDSHTNEYRNPTWTEIFVEIGRLLSLRDFRDYEGNISELECKLEDLEKKIKSEIHPNL